MIKTRTRYRSRAARGTRFRALSSSFLLAFCQTRKRKMAPAAPSPKSQSRRGRLKKKEKPSFINLNSINRYLLFMGNICSFLKVSGQ